MLGCKGLILYAGRLFLFCEVGLSSKCRLHVTYEPQDVVLVLKCHFNFFRRQLVSQPRLCPSRRNLVKMTLQAGKCYRRILRLARFYTTRTKTMLYFCSGIKVLINPLILPRPPLLTLPWHESLLAESHSIYRSAFEGQRIYLQTSVHLCGPHKALDMMVRFLPYFLRFSRQR